MVNGLITNHQLPNHSILFRGQFVKTNAKRRDICKRFFLNLNLWLFAGLLARPFLCAFGQNYWSAEHPDYFVKCRQSTRVKKWNLVVRNDHPAKRWIFDGGI
jgi:hypothetical protein